MTTSLYIEKFSLGIGDRFSHQAKAQLEAIQKAEQEGIDVIPVWNKSYREHQIIGSKPEMTRKMVDRAVKQLGWTKSFYHDADHINLSNVDDFIESCDFFTIDVADYIGQQSRPNDIDTFVRNQRTYSGEIELPGDNEPLKVSEDRIREVAAKYLHAVRQAGNIYRYIEERKGCGNFITEVSMDETDAPQTPLELFFILGALAGENIPLQTIAPKFSGRFNKGVDYAGDVGQFRDEFEKDVAILKIAVKEFNLPSNLKLSVHSGSDKFSLYPEIGRIIKKYDSGLHLKTAGTTWLEELIGLAESGSSGLELAKEIYRQACDRSEELCAPYASVIDIDLAKLPEKEEVTAWSAADYTSALRHDLSNPWYNVHFRQLLHVGYKIAAQMGERYLEALQKNEPVISKNVSENIYERHIRPLFL
jgi:hypothetical protein